MSGSFENDIIKLLRDLIRTPSFSGQETKTADIIQDFFIEWKIPVKRYKNNIVVEYRGISTAQPYILLCSHHDTVKPNNSYTRDPYSPDLEDGKLFGLGSNDAGGALVSLIGAFLNCYREKKKINLILAAVAEEENSGANGVQLILPNLPEIELAIVGEPTQMRMAVAEKGLMVIDGISPGIPGHAAHENTVNPIYQACEDILKIRSLTFDRESAYLGKTKISVTQIHAGDQHNQVPAECRFVIDCRVNELYTLEEVLEILQNAVASTLVARSLRLRSSGITPDHKINRIADVLNIPKFGSPTLSDQALIPWPSVKIGPGDSLRSHTADEFIFVKEITEGIKDYIRLLDTYITNDP